MLLTTMLKVGMPILLTLLTVLSSNAMVSRKCRCLPNNGCWPDDQAWANFNSSLSGRLLMTKPPLYFCHEPHFDEAACNIVRLGYFDGVWRSDQPTALQNTNWEMNGSEGCQNPNKNAPCLQGAIPIYTVNASSVLDIQKAVIFAHQHNLRLVVKNTGHDFLGRSTGPGSLSIWTHHLNTTIFHKSFTPENCDNNIKTSAVSVGAGVQWDHLYQATEEQGVNVVGGAGPTVGAAGGYAQGGGHSPLSVKYGLCVDNVLQYKIITADGKLRTANACQNPDLFWALRGGGGGTFGVVVEVTHKTYKSFENIIGTAYQINATDIASYKDLIKEFIHIQPALSDVGWAGYFSLGDKQLSWAYLFPNSSTSFALATLAPLLSFVGKHSNLTMGGNIYSFPSFHSWYKVFGTESSGTAAILGSRLVPRKNFETKESIDQLTDVLLKVQEKSKYAPIIGHLVAGGAVSRNNGPETSVLPAWRSALWHTIITNGWSGNTTVAEQQRLARDLTNTTKLLRDITPGSGAYLNEADANEPDWQQSFFGSNYLRLKAIKTTYDPYGLFVCRKCVGSEEWSEDLNCPIS
ncbi:hypothetical protein K7432_005371 [Basidiobolus ranarum]|uniref:FAD-binding PCMH-type domain-containing protein n=1 Tax=Basidiobolus ranarum TaxID=34480 RepID=A0ABR2W3L8_9FUNG